MTPEQPSGATPVTRFRVRTTDPDLAVRYQRTYTDFVEDPVVREGFAFAMEGSTVGPVSVARVHHSSTFRATAEPTPALVALELLDGTRVRLDDGRDDVAGPVMLAPHRSRFRAHWDTCTVRTAAVEPDELARVGAEISGLTPDRIAVTGLLPVSGATARYWTQLTAHLRRIVAQDELMASPIVSAEVVRRLASGMLTAFPNTTLDHRHGGGRDGAGPASLRQASAFIDDNAHRAITLSDIAEAANLSARGLQKIFRRYRDRTPLEELRRVRMARAHADLLAADPTRGDRVAAIAARWGFAHAGRFSADYRQAYGRPPGHTLRE